MVNKDVCITTTAGCEPLILRSCLGTGVFSLSYCCMQYELFSYL